MSLNGSLQERIEHWFAQGAAAVGNAEAEAAFFELRKRWRRGAAGCGAGCFAAAWVARECVGETRDFAGVSDWDDDGDGWARRSSFMDKAYLSGAAVCAGGWGAGGAGWVSVRTGAYVAKGVAVIPPAYVNVGAYVDEGTMVDSHALVGSCAQVGKRVHLSAAAQIGGVLEPVNASPVIIEDDCLLVGIPGFMKGRWCGNARCWRLGRC